MLYEGIDFFKLNNIQILNYIKINPNNFDIYEIKKLGEYKIKFNKNELEDDKDFIILHETVDYHTSDSLELFCRNYNIDENTIKLLERKEKLNNLKMNKL
jgi:hypothetical protein